MTCGLFDFRFFVRLGIVLTGASTFAVACRDGPTEPGVPQYVRVRPEWVVGEAAVALDSVSGQFRLPDPHPAHVVLPSAETLAVAVARLYGDPNQIGNGPLVVQQDRGGPIDFNDLRVCDRATYSVSPFGEFPPEVPGSVRRAWGSAWAIALCGNDATAQLSIGVPDNPMDVRIVDGEIVFRQFGGGGDFSAVGVPYRYPFGLPLTPEEAVAVVVQLTGRVVVRVPVAFNQHDDRGIGQFPLCASWKVEVDRAVSVRSQATGAIAQVRELFVRRAPACFSDSIALYTTAADQPANRWIAFPKDTIGMSTNTEVDSAQVPLTGPALFERVTIEQ